MNLPADTNVTPGRWIRTIAGAFLLVFGAMFVFAGCSSTTPTGIGDDTVIIDVRTPAEYSEGHLAGAVNIDVSSPAFLDSVAELPNDGNYVVYCRSGNRSAQAATIMRDRGFKHVTDAGAVNDASESTGRDIVTS